MIYWKRHLLFVLGNCLLLLLLSGCLGGGGTAADQAGQERIFGSDVTLPSGPATLICSGACYDRAQCGVDPAQGDVVLLSTNGPAVSGHNLWQANNTPVTITTSQPRTVQKLLSGEQYSVEFYEVLLPDAQSAWVAGWCIHQ